MKTLLTATDFSAASRNAVNYAAAMAVAVKAQLIILHVYSVPVVTEVPLPASSLEDIEKRARKRLKRMADTLQKKYGKKLQLTYLCRCGFALDEIKTAVKEKGANLLITGMQGAGYVAERLMGSITTALMTESNCPVLCVDKRMPFERPKKIVFATDLKGTVHKEYAGFLQELVELFKAKLLLLNVFKPGNAMPTVGEATEGMKLDTLLRGVKHSFHYAENADVVAGINTFVKDQKADLVVMIGRRHSLLERLFKEPQTKRMAFHASRPLLVFHD